MHPIAYICMMLVTSDASDHLVDGEMIPRLLHRMKDHQTLKEPKTILTAGNENVFAMTTGTIWDTLSTRLDSVFQSVPPPRSYLN